MKILGDKIRQARVLRGKSITELAVELGVSKQAVFQYENDITEPKREVIFRLTGVLDFPVNFFTTPYATEIRKSNTFFRANLTASKSEKMSLEERAALVAYFYDFLQEYLDMLVLNIPKYDDTELDEKDYETIAMKARAFWELGNGPILNMVSLLEENGVVLSTVKVTDKKIDAFTQPHNKNIFCVIIEDTKHSMVRRNFTLAHELGHILMHSSASFDELEKEAKKRIEDEANLFAASFLLPRNAFIQDLRDPHDLDFYIYLKRKWHVSILAMIMRARSLRLIDEKSYMSLIKKYNYRRYRLNEPLDDIITIKKPVLFEQSLRLLLDSGHLTIDALMSNMALQGLAMSEKDIIDFFALENDFFTPYSQPKNMGIALKAKFDS